MSPERARQVVKREGYSLVDLFHLVEAWAEQTGAGLDIESPRVRVRIKKLPLRKPAKKVKR